MKIIKYSLGQLQANCYFLIEGEKCLIIDPADEASFILEEIQKRKLKLVGLLATHGHFDHVMAAGEIQMSFDVPFYISREDKFLMNRFIETAEHFLGYKPSVVEPKKFSFLKEKELKISNFKLQIIQTPGHTPGSYCFYFEKDNIIFTGDTLFKQGIGRYDFSYSSKKDLKNSLKNLLKLPKETVVYSGHGEETTIGKEKKNISLRFID
jgi:glyoxylase-like metal-dependent hydrolase (beta-lactamase superfamily II)